MDAAAIREAVRRQPFQPFTLRLADGRALLVTHPELVAVAPNNTRVVAFSSLDGSMSILDFGPPVGPLPPPSAHGGPASGS